MGLFVFLIDQNRFFFFLLTSSYEWIALIFFWLLKFRQALASCVFFQPFLQNLVEEFELHEGMGEALPLTVSLASILEGTFFFFFCLLFMSFEVFLDCWTLYSCCAAFFEKGEIGGLLNLTFIEAIQFPQLMFQSSFRSWCFLLGIFYATSIFVQWLHAI